MNPGSVDDNTGVTTHITSQGGYVDASIAEVDGTASGLDFPQVSTYDNGTQNGFAGVYVDGGFGGSPGAYQGDWQSIVTLTPGDNVISAGPRSGTTATSDDTIDDIYIPTPPSITIAQMGGTTTSAAQTLSGSVSTDGLGSRFVAGTTLTLSEGGTTLGRTTVGNDGEWNAGLTLPHSGYNPITVTDTDVAGDTGEAYVSLDLQPPPSIHITGPGGYVNFEAAEVQGTAAGLGVPIVEVYDNGVPAGPVGVYQSNGEPAGLNGPDSGSWQTEVSLTPGDNVISAGPYNGTTPTSDDTVDEIYVATPPNVMIAQTGGATTSLVQTLSGSVSTSGFGSRFVAGTALTLSEGGTVLGRATVGTDGGWSAKVDLQSQGFNLITVADTDVAGNTGEADVDFEVANSVSAPSVSTPSVSTPSVSTASVSTPSVSITSGGGLTNQALQTISGTGTVAGVGVNDVVVTEDGKVVGGNPVIGDGTWQAPIDLGGDGTHTIQATIRDRYGNVGTSATVTYALKTSLPAILIGSTGGLTDTDATTVSGSADSGTQVALLDDGVAVAATTAAPDGSWSLGLTLAQGANNLTATATDAAGNVGYANTITDTLDTSPPALSFGPAPQLSGTAATLTGAASDAVGVTGVEVFDGSTDLGAAQVDGSGNWTFSHDFGQGTYDHLTAVATDAAGNTARAAAPFDLDTASSGGRSTGEVRTIDANGAVTAVTTMAADGSIGAQTVSNGDGTATGTGYENGQSLFSIGNDVMTGNGYRENFVFQPTMGHARVTDFVVSGPGHDTLTLSHGDFDNVAQVLNSTTMNHGAAVIHVSPDDTIRLVGVTRADLAQHRGDFAFTA